MTALWDYHAPYWLPGGNLQTIWPALLSRPYAAETPAYRRERWRAPDSDFIDVDHLIAAPGAPWLVLFHGLEGSSASHYAVAFAQAARARGWNFSVPHFRGCSGELNLAPRSYHSGDFEEIGWMLGRLRERAGAAVLAAGVSLGGNALLRWAEEAGSSAASMVSAVAAISAPLDLAAAGAEIDHGFNWLVYTQRFLRTMKPNALAKWQQHPNLFDRDRLIAANTLRDFDDCFTAPLHGFAGVDDYYRRASARPHLGAIRVPALVLTARNDPFVPAASLPDATDVGAQVTLWQPAQGGHVGFPGGSFPGHVHAMPQAVCGWLADAYHRVC
ncbi:MULTISPECIES: alpha/beta fold hydrolase [Rhodopseudomonas]|uniref:Alpha/beta hydrolase n=1 Tax=Rhodopseudomonas palustris TaxID=1076 RepID=A0A0D7DZY1_RHOPL|nr:MULTISPECIES: alpha/beta fold hydrolase [Rhodopseudomonas]KIZ33806.1 alpha/beta hydrolase [Rhodopseudomonas palustris]MDF3814458.1 alpha/beta fold hydrolase [Rhodopseudomonas sp. BAL398]WOK18879.1 alpha/beta fold hydrolase [Rhodopseudomonas sp. BAL398]